jgi:glycine/D-amino acid oxidase-like deaminating enzyme
MTRAEVQIRRVAVIGAGISGVVAAAHLLKAGLQVKVFERSHAAGGVWFVIPLLAYLGSAGLTLDYLGCLMSGGRLSPRIQR